MEKINVTKTFLPPLEDYQKYLQQIWDRDFLTNQGPLLLDLEEKLKTINKTKYFHMVGNGTLALQIALRALDISEGEVITTPFSYVATTSSILWERCEPVFVDIEPDNFCIDPDKIEAAITRRTKAIMPVHVFGTPCDVDRIEAIARKHKLKIIYDAAHAFGVEHQGRSLLSYGDISTCSFHATKLFHTIEGGCIVAKDKDVSDKIELMKRFGHQGDEHHMLGINAKASEFQAAMGLTNLKYIDGLIEERKRLSKLYDEQLGNAVHRSVVKEDTKHNYGYYPITLESKRQLLRIVQELNGQNIFPRRYFYPSLNTLPYIKKKYSCPVSEDIAERVLCLPLFPGLDDQTVIKICETIKQ